MASLKQRFTTLLAEMEYFLVETLKGAKLSKNAVSEKDGLLEKVRKMTEELSPGMSSKRNAVPGASSPSVDSSGSVYTEAASSQGDGSDGSLAGTQQTEDSGDGAPKVAVSSLKNVFQRSQLEKKKKSGLKTWESVYCVVSGNMFYVYKKSTDTKQKEEFCLTGYDFKEDPDKGDTYFELTKPGTVPHQFRAADKDALQEWKQSINKGIQFVPENEERYENANLQPANKNKKGSHESVTSHPLPRTRDEEEDDQEIYDDIGPTSAHCYTNTGLAYQNQYETPQQYQNVGAYDAMGQAPPLPAPRQASQATSPVNRQDRTAGQTSSAPEADRPAGRPRSFARSPKLPPWPPSARKDSDEEF